MKWKYYLLQLGLVAGIWWILAGVVDWYGWKALAVIAMVYLYGETVAESRR